MVMKTDMLKQEAKITKSGSKHFTLLQSGNIEIQNVSYPIAL